MAAAAVSFSIDQGQDLFLRFELYRRGESGEVAWDLTGHSALMQLREEPESPSVIVELSTANGRLVIPGGEDGNVLEVRLTAAETAAIVFPESGRAVYDLVITADDGYKTRLTEGFVDLNPGVSR